MKVKTTKITVDAVKDKINNRLNEQNDRDNREQDFGRAYCIKNLLDTISTLPDIDDFINKDNSDEEFNLYVQTGQKILKYFKMLDNESIEENDYTECPQYYNCDACDKYEKCYIEDEEGTSKIDHSDDKDEIHGQFINSLFELMEVLKPVFEKECLGVEPNILINISSKRYIEIKERMDRLLLSSILMTCNKTKK